MSLLMFAHHEDHILVFADTLATSMDGTPYNFSNKCSAIPTMNLLVAVTGLANLHERWVTLLREKMLARDIVMLDRHATPALQDLWSQIEAEEGGSLPTTCTVYHFGVDELSGECVRITYRSDNSFESEYGSPGHAVKPPPEAGFAEDLLRDLNGLEDLGDWIKLATLIRAEQDAMPMEERIHIGGDIMLTALTSDGSITIQRLARFDDYDAHWEAMNRAHRDSGEHQQDLIW